MSETGNHNEILMPAVEAASHKLLEKLGYVEVLPHEVENARDLRWSAAQCNAIVMGSDQISDSSEQTLNSQEQRADFLQRSNAILEDIEVDTPDLVADGVIRRLAGNPRRREHFGQVVMNGYHEDYEVIDRLIHQIEATKAKIQEKQNHPKVLLVGHLGQMAATPVVGHSRIGVGMDAFTASGSTPNLGLASVASELAVEMDDEVDIRYADVTDTASLDEAVLKGDYQAILFQVNSDSMQIICEFRNKFDESGANVVLGGVGTILDTPYLAAHAKGTQFYGEIEHRGGELRDLVMRESQSPTPVPKQVGYADMEVSFAPERESAGYLRTRMESLERQKPFVKVAGKFFEVPVLTHEVQFSRGCPFVCSFCSTVESEGQSMRRRSVDSIINELGAMGITYGVDASEEEKEKFTRPVFLAVPDQNAFDRGRNESPKEWIEYMVDLLGELTERKISLATQTSLGSLMKMAVQSRRMIATAESAIDALYENETPAGRKQAREILGSESDNTIGLRMEAIEMKRKYARFDHLLGKSLVSALVGVENDSRIKGTSANNGTEWFDLDWDRMTADEIVAAFDENERDVFAIGKEPAYYNGIVAYARKIGIPLLGSCISGMPPSMTRDDSSLLFATDMTEAERGEVVDRWMEFLCDNLGLDIAMVQAFIPVRGAGKRLITADPAVGLENMGLDISPENYYKEPENLGVGNIDAQKSAAEVVREFYSLKRVLKRLGTGIGTYSAKRYVAMAVINLSFFAQRFNSDKNAVHEALSKPYWHPVVLSDV